MASGTTEVRQHKFVEHSTIPAYLYPKNRKLDAMSIKNTRRVRGRGVAGCAAFPVPDRNMGTTCEDERSRKVVAITFTLQAFP